MPKIEINKSLFITLAFSFLILLYFAPRGFTTFDEGYVLHAAQRLLGGEAMFKDFNYVYMPGSAFLTAIPLLIFGESILSGRILMLALSLFASFALYKLIFQITKKEFLAILSVLTYLSWGPTHINFPWPTMFAVVFGIFYLHYLVQAAATGENKYLYISGILAGLVFLFKQNFGIAAVANTAIAALLINGKTLKKNIALFYGMAVVIIAFAVLLLLSGSLPQFISDFYEYTIRKITIEGAITTPFLYGEGIEKILKFGFYTIPFWISGLAIVFAYIKQVSLKKYLFLSTFVLLFYLFGIRPVTDYNHVSPLISLVGIPAVLILYQLKKDKLKLLGYLILISIITSGFYTALYKGYYRWGTPLIKQNRFISDPRVRVFTDDKHFEIIPRTISLVKDNTKVGDYIFSYKYAPIFYFITDRKNPTRYSSISRGVFRGNTEDEVLKDLKSKDVKIAVLQSYEIEGVSPVTSYIFSNFRIVEYLDGYHIMFKK